jgi:hypothetical protein
MKARERKARMIVKTMDVGTMEGISTTMKKLLTM